jgi:hypothetical protein
LVKRKKKIEEGIVVVSSFLLTISRLLLKTIMALVINEPRRHGHSIISIPQHDDDPLLKTYYTISIIDKGPIYAISFQPTPSTST